MRLSDNLPLRSTTEWAEYQISAVIPLRYGRDVWGECLPYNQTLTDWVWAGHASQGIDQVTVDGLDTAGFDFRNTTDTAGKPITLIRLSEGIDPGRTVHARGRGAINSETGALIDSPADVLHDLARIQGVSLTRNDLTTFAQECAARNLRLSFSVEDPESLQAIARRMAQQLCAIYSPSMTGWLRLLPLSATAVPLASITDRELGEAEQSAADLATRIDARYAYRLGEPTQSIVIRDSNALDEVTAVLELDMLADKVAVFDIALRTLSRRGRRPYRVAASLRGRVVPGTAVALQSTELDVTETVPVVTASYDPTTDRTAATVEVRVDTTPVALQLVSSSEQVTASERTLPPGAAGDGGQRVTILGPNGPRVGARVTLDGRITRLTDSAGVVVFPANLLTPGEHTLDVEPTDAPHYRMIINV